MGMVPRGRDSVARQLNHEGRITFQEIRRQPSTDPEPNQSLEPYLATGWTTETAGTAMHARFYKDRDRVYFEGIVEYAGPSGAGEMIDALPVGYRPAGYDGVRNVILPTDPDNTETSTNGKFWIGEVLADGTLALDQHPDYTGSPNFGWPPVGTFLVLSFSFRISS